MADYSSLEAIEKRIAASGRPMTRAEASTLAPLRTKRRKDEEARAEQSRPKTRAEAATRMKPAAAPAEADRYKGLRDVPTKVGEAVLDTATQGMYSAAKLAAATRMKQAAAPAEADRYKGLRDVPTKVGEAVLDTATQGMYSAAKLAAPAVKSAIEFLGRESSQPVRNRAEAATYMKNRNASQPASSAGDGDLKSYFDAVEKARQNPPVSFMEKLQNAGTQEEPALKDYSRPTETVKLESNMFPEGVEVAKGREPTLKDYSRPTETVKLESNMFPEGVEVAATAPSTAMAESPPKAKPVIDEARMASLFRKTTGTAFNPKSRVDKARMAELTSFIEEDPERLNKSDTKIALDFYRTLK